MNVFGRNKLICHLIAMVILTFLVAGVAYASLDQDVSESRPMETITSISVQEGPVTLLVIEGDGLIPVLTSETLLSPPRIFIDLQVDVPSFDSMHKQLSGPYLKSVRVGHHPKSIRLVMDVVGPDIPEFSTIRDRKKLFVRIGPGVNEKKDDTGSTEDTHSPEDDQDFITEPDNTEIMEGRVDTGSTEDIHSPEDIGDSISEPEHAEALDEKTIKYDSLGLFESGYASTEEYPKMESARSEIFYADEDLLQLDEKIDQSAGAVYLEAVNAYRAEDWSGTINHLKSLIENSSNSIYSEKACFLLAKTYSNLYASSLFEHFGEIKGCYEDAIYRYPESRYAPDAYLSIGNLFFLSKTYSEALGYYKMVIDMDKITGARLKAQLQKAKVLSITGKKKEALATYGSFCSNYPDLAERVQAEVEMALILFEMNQFNKSLDILTRLEKNKENTYLYPDIISYLGNNYYQVGSFSKSRQYLFKYYNGFAGEKQSPLILARIADTYKEEDLIDEAIKFYQLVLKLHPKTEGTLISMCRLAELQENGDFSPTEEFLSKFDIIGESINLPRKIYNEVLKTAVDNNVSSPLIELVLMKLAIIDCKEGDYEKSIERLKTLQIKYPQTKNRQEVGHIFKKTILSIFQKYLKEKKYEQILNTYHSEKMMIDKLNSPDIFIAIARGALKLNLVAMGIEMFKQASLNMPDGKKPADLLFYIGHEYFDRGDLEKALAHMDLLLKEYPEDEFTSEAWELKGKICFSNNDFREASGMFENALKYNENPARQVQILIHLAKTLVHMKSDADAFQVLEDVEDRILNSQDEPYTIYEEMGKLYLQLGNPDKAVSLIKKALNRENDEGVKIRLKFFIAQCYEFLNEKDSYMAIYSEIANQDDSFWASLAKEKMDTIKFKQIALQNKE